ncbi:GNAT family N-acetyltransferase [Segatella copri]|uniref:GNAT family N-acetyltransferase n=1 Tax=Segatella copri TaxID=165179 RepID=A0AA92UMZ4_9BACT|nr:GNAT family N-acetyltransferase [Segatella copri]
MTKEELFSMCRLEEITPHKLAQCEPFECENKDLNDFFANDAVKYAKRLLGKTYVFSLRENPQTIVAAFTVSNDSIRMTNKLNEESKLIFLHETELEDKCLRRFPAVLIGRLATNKNFAGKGIGTAVMDFIKYWFRFDNKTGCRFIIVDAYSNEATLHYYLKTLLSRLEIIGPEKARI